MTTIVAKILHPVVRVQLKGGFVPVAVSGGGDMTKAVYDTDNDGVVDDSERLAGQLAAYYAQASILASHVADTANPHSVTKSQIGLNNVDNTSDINKPVSTAQAAADLAVLNSAQGYADSLVIGLLDDRGNFDASTNVYPSAGGSGTAGAIMKGDLWTVNIAGSPGGNPVTAGDVLRSLIDTPGQTASNWAITENNFGYVAENSANKDSSSGYVGLSGWSIKFRNLANTFTSFFQNAATAARTYIFPDRDGTVALLDDLVSVFVTARNNTASQILKGKAVYITGAIGQNPTMALARANAEATSFDIGLTTEDIPINTNVQNNVTTIGLMTGVDTSAFSDGDKLWLSTTVAGELQNTPPTSPNYTMFVGFCLYSHAVNGKILVLSDRKPISQNTTIDNSLISVPSNNVLAINLALKEAIANKGAANGYAPLDADSVVPVVNGGSKLVAKNYTPASNVANTSELLLHSHQIPAGIVEAGDMLEFYANLLFTGSANIKTWRVYVNTANTLAGATLIGTLSSAGGIQTVDNFQRYIPVIDDITFEMMGGTTVSERSAFGIANGTSINVTVPSVSSGFWILISGQKATAGETNTIRWSMVRLNKG